jgi:hypothetical protein
MLYKITNTQHKTAQNGSSYVQADLIDQNGQLYSRVSAWNGEFDGKDTWEGELVKNGNYWNLPRAPRTNTAWAGRPPAGGASREAERNENIKKNMEEKEQGIAYHHAHNFALQFVKEYVCNPSISDPSEALIKIREFTQIFYEDYMNWRDQLTKKQEPPF